MRRTLITIAAALAAASLNAQVTIQQGSSLSKLINNLYGGDGIQLRAGGHQAHFGDTEDFQQFSAVLQKTLQARPVFPVPSSVGVVSFKFNEETGTYERVQSSFGPILAERATTSGKGNTNIAVSYTFSDFENFNGADSIPLVLHHCLTFDCTFGKDAPYLHDVIDVDVRLKLKSQALSTSFVYGVSDRLDLGLVIPFIRNDLDVFTQARVIVSPGSDPATHVFDPAVETPDQLGTAHAIGIGDVIARGKLQIPLKMPFQTALLTDVTVPTGDKENFLGTGDLRIKETVIVSRSGARFSPHLNAGYEWNTKNANLSTVDYRLGSEMVVTPRLTIAGDLLGIVQPSAAPEFRVRALEDQSLIGRSQIDGAIGAKWKISARSLLTLNFLTPLNDTGIRPNSVISFGIQTGL